MLEENIFATQMAQSQFDQSGVRASRVSKASATKRGNRSNVWPISQEFTYVKHDKGLLEYIFYIVYMNYISYMYCIICISYMICIMYNVLCIFTYNLQVYTKQNMERVVL